MNEENIKKSIDNLKKKFIKIRDMKYVKSINNNSSGIGLTFEKLLGKEIDNFPLPDYHNIELKTKLAYSTRPITLFRLTPDGKNFFELKRIINEYGYYTKNSNEYKSLSSEVTAIYKKKIESNYYLKLHLNYKMKKLELHIYDIYGRLIDSNAYWEFEKIKIALFRKLQYLAVITTYGMNKNGEYYYKYYKLTMYKLKSFNDFLQALNSGLVIIGFSIDTYKTGPKKGLPHNHGVCFKIYESNLSAIFKKI